MSTTSDAKHRRIVKPRRPGRLVRRPVALNGRHPAANRAATPATAATTGGQKIDYTRGRWPQIQFRRVGCTPPSSPNAARRRCDESHPTKLTLTQDADGKSLMDLNLSIYPSEEGKALFKYHVVRGTGQTVAAGTFATAPIVELTAPTPGDDAFYEFFAWLDKNNNGLRDAGEEVKTLAAQQAQHVITATSPANPVARPAANAADVLVSVTITVTSNNKPVQGVAFKNASPPRPAGVIEPAPQLVGLTGPGGTLVIQVLVTPGTTAGRYVFVLKEDGWDTDPNAEGSFTIIIQ